MDEFTVTYRPEAGHAVRAPSGELTVRASCQHRNELLHARPAEGPHVVVRLRACDPPGLVLLLPARQRVRKAGGDIVLAAAAAARAAPTRDPAPDQPRPLFE